MARQQQPQDINFGCDTFRSYGVNSSQKKLITAYEKRRQENEKLQLQLRQSMRAQRMQHEGYKRKSFGEAMQMTESPALETETPLESSISPKSKLSYKCCGTLR